MGKYILRILGLTLVVQTFFTIDQWQWWTLCIGLNFIIVTLEN